MIIILNSNGWMSCSLQLSESQAGFVKGMIEYYKFHLGDITSFNTYFR